MSGDDSVNWLITPAPGDTARMMDPNYGYPDVDLPEELRPEQEDCNHDSSD